MGNRGGRNPGGCGRSVMWRHNATFTTSLSNSETELDDTATSPEKSKNMDLDKRDLTN
jgi:hypothetical protein